MTAELPIADRLARIEERIAAACRRVGRERAEVTLIGASKVHPAAAVAEAWRAGLEIFGENRVQEAEAKAPQLPTGIDWHLIGPLQSNKVRRAVALFSTIHAVDRVKIARAIDRIAAESGVERRALLEVNLAAEESKHGLLPEQLPAAIDELAELTQLEIVGLMAIPPAGPNPEAARPWFERLRLLGEQVAARGAPPSWRGWLSMGMSGDYEVAIEEGATHIRIGSSLFGPRPTAARRDPA